MKNFVRLAIATAVAVGATSGAFAQVQQPNTGSSDLWVFVTDPGASDTFAWDTGISLNSLTPTTLSTTAKATTTTDPVNIDVQSSALASFIGSSSDAGALQWAVEGVQFTGSAAADKAQGTLVGVVSNNAATASIAALKQANLGTWASGFQGDVGYLALAGYTAGSQGSAYAFSAGSTAGNVWGSSTGNSAGSTNMYNQGPTQAGTAVGTAESLYLLTGSNSLTAAVESYTLAAADLTLSANGTLSAMAPSSAVPLPAAVWLFGSGLLGVMGVGRRRAA